MCACLTLSLLNKFLLAATVLSLVSISLTNCLRYIYYDSYFAGKKWRVPCCTRKICTTKRSRGLSLSLPHLIWLSHDCIHTHTHIYICMHCNGLDDHNLLYQKLIITPVKKELGLAFKGNQKMVVEALEVFIVCALLFVIPDTHMASLFLRNLKTLVGWAWL